MDSSRRRQLEGIGVALFFVLLTIPMYFPISLNMGSTIFDRWDGFLHTWILAWDVHKFTTGLAGFWDANIFWPHHDALAYSDHLISSALLAAPFLLISHNPVLAHNAITYLGFVLGGLGMYLLVRRLTGHGWAAVIAGMIYVYCPWRFGQMGHETQLLSSQWLPFALLFFHRSLHDGRSWDGILTGLFFGLHALSSFYMAAMGSVVIATIFLVELVRARGRFSRAVWVRLTLTGIVVSLMIAPTVLPYYRVAKSQGLIRTVAESQSMSADPADYFCAPPWNRFWGWTAESLKNRNSPFPNENWLFAGVAVLLLAGWGLFAAGRRKWEPNQAIYFWVTAVSFVFSLGPWLHVLWHRFRIPLPYLAAYYLVPGFKGLRVPARFASMVELGLAVLAAYGFIGISSRLKSKVGNVIFGLLVPALILTEFFSAPLPHHQILSGDRVPQVYKWLAAQPGDFAIFEIPELPGFELLPVKKRPIGDPLGFSYMYYSAYHWKKLVNGRSGFLPNTTTHIYSAMMNFPSAQTVNILRYLGVKYVVLHTGGYEWDENFDAARYAEEVGKILTLTNRFGTDLVYEVPNPLGAEQRNDLNNIGLADYFVPNKVKPGAKFNIELCLSNPTDMPIYSFGLVDMDSAAEIRSSQGNSTQSSKQRNLIMLDPGELGWIVLTFTAPKDAGEYNWLVNFSIGGAGKYKKYIEFKQEVGDYPDSNAPDLLKARFIELEVPKTVKAGEIFAVKAVVRNEGNTFWRAYRFEGQSDYRGVVMLGLGDWRDMAGKSMGLDRAPYSTRGFLYKSVPPGASEEVLLKATAPENPGKYTVSIQMVDEFITWFEYAGGEKITAEIEVTP